MAAQEKIQVEVPIMADMIAKGRRPEYLWWVGSAGAFDDRYKKVTQAFAKVLTYLKTSYAVLGSEESSSGDIVRRSGNEMLFQMQALTNIEILKEYKVGKILSCDPHAYNTFKNEYPDLGGNYEVIHHSEFLVEICEAQETRPKAKNIAKAVLITYFISFPHCLHRTIHHPIILLNPLPSYHSY